MEVIQLSGYTAQDKLQIAKRYLVPRQIERNGLSKTKIEFADDALAEIIDGYTREAGVRNLERELGAVCRKVAREFAEGTRKSQSARCARRRSQSCSASARSRPTRRAAPRCRASRPDSPGPRSAATSSTSRRRAYPGKGGLQITGQLGDVMRESAQAALSWIKGHYKELGADLADDWFATHDIHIHVPAGAVPKDGPSAGVTMTTALASLITGRCVRSDVAMTGEITLTGQVLPIGGLKEKSLAAQQMGMKLVLAPADNEADVDEIPKPLLKNVKFEFVSTIDEVLALALEPRRDQSRPKRVTRSHRPTVAPEQRQAFRSQARQGGAAERHKHLVSAFQPAFPRSTTWHPPRPRSSTTRLPHATDQAKENPYLQQDHRRQGAARERRRRAPVDQVHVRPGQGKGL